LRCILIVLSAPPPPNTQTQVTRERLRQIVAQARIIAASVLFVSMLAHPFSIHKPAEKQVGTAASSMEWNPGWAYQLSCCGVQTSEDLKLDVPRALDLLPLFVARAVIDDLLPPIFVTKLSLGTLLLLPSINFTAQYHLTSKSKLVRIGLYFHASGPVELA